MRPDLGDLKPTHRLDRLVSGCLILARNKRAAHALGEAFRDRGVVKTYAARVKGSLSALSVRVEDPIGLVSPPDDPPVYGIASESEGGKVSTRGDSSFVIVLSSRFQWRLCFCGLFMVCL